MSSYPGGKGSAFRQIINQIPPHPVYIEPFLGGGAVMRNIRPALVNIGVDLSARAVLDLADEMGLGDAVATIASNGAGAAAAAAAAAEGRFTVSTDYPVYELYVMDALLFLELYPFQGGEMVYLDPPYLMETRRSQRQLYLFEFDRDQHEALLALVTTLPCFVAISGYESDLYKRALADWRSITFEAQTRGNTTATEWLWMNYPEPEQLHDTSWLGQDYRERERIKRKKARWVAKLERMDAQERQALLEAIRDKGLLPPGPPPAAAGPDRHRPAWWKPAPAQPPSTPAETGGADEARQGHLWEIPF